MTDLRVRHEHRGAHQFNGHATLGFERRISLLGRDVLVVYDVVAAFCEIAGVAGWRYNYEFFAPTERG